MNFALRLHRYLKDSRQFPVDIARQLQSECGLTTSREDVSGWLLGNPVPQWDQVLPALERLTGVPVEEWLAGPSEPGGRAPK